MKEGIKGRRKCELPCYTSSTIVSHFDCLWWRQTAMTDWAGVQSIITTENLSRALKAQIIYSALHKGAHRRHAAASAASHNAPTHFHVGLRKSGS